MNLQPLWTPIVDDFCRDHDCDKPCSDCAERERDKTDAAAAQEYYDRAEQTRAWAVTHSQEDCAAMMAWADEQERRGSAIFGRLQRIADEQSRAAEDARL